MRRNEIDILSLSSRFLGFLRHTANVGLEGQDGNPMSASDVIITLVMTAACVAATRTKLQHAVLWAGSLDVNGQVTN